MMKKILREILISLIKALSYMQENNISHRDIKPKNILIIDGKNIVLVILMKVLLLKKSLIILIF